MWILRICQIYILLLYERCNWTMNIKQTIKTIDGFFSFTLNIFWKYPKCSFMHTDVISHCCITNGMKMVKMVKKTPLILRPFKNNHSESILRFFDYYVFILFILFIMFYFLFFWLKKKKCSKTNLKTWWRS